MTATVTFASVFLKFTLFGVFLGSSLVEHAMRNLPGPTWVAYKQAKERIFGPVMPAIFGIGLLVSLTAAVVARQHAPLAVAAALMVAALVITVAVHLPLNGQFQAWDAHSAPQNWSELRARWRNWNWVRTVLVAAAALIASAVISSAAASL